MNDSDLAELQKDLINLLSKHIDPEDPGTLLRSSGVLLKVAIQLYTVGLKNNQDIEKVLDFAKTSIDPLRKQTINYILENEKRVLH